MPVPKVPWSKRGLDRFASLVPATRVALGDKVWWEETIWAAGYPSTYWTFGLVETKRGKVCVIRDRHGFERVVGVGMLFKPES
jgi:hypothetical protein